MKVGGHHKWYYQEGVWKERKEEPDRWSFRYAVNKRRAGHAPPGSGAPLGTEYHWYILAHQVVEKLDENTYSTEMEGSKYKVAHARASTGTWNVSTRPQGQKLAKILEAEAARLREGTPMPGPSPAEAPKKPVSQPRSGRTRRIGQARQNRPRKARVSRPLATT